MSREAAQFVRRQFDIAHCTRALEAQYDRILSGASLAPAAAGQPSWNTR